MKVAFYTLGCKVNSYETEVLTEKFRRRSCEIVPFSSVADIYVVNTCTVTAISDHKSRQALHSARTRNPAAVVVAAGCYPQAAPEEMKKLDGVDIVVGNLNKYELVDLAMNAVKTTDIPDNTKYAPYREERVTGGGARTRASIKIEDGCNNFCSYCKIPYARGRVRSKPLEQAVNEFKGLIGAGYNEIVVTGIEVASYGEDTGDSLAELLAQFDGLCNADTRIRLGSLEPRLITEDFAERLASLTHICPQYHLSMQSGCDSVLARMNRKYDTALFAQSAENLRKHIDGVKLTTDLIVGFPGETEDEFRQTLAFLKKMKFLKVHVFPYSKREGTAAERMPSHIGNAVKKERAARAGELCESIRKKIMERAVGSRVTVLFETRKNGLWQGYTPDYMPVSMQSRDNLHNCFREVTVVSVSDGRLIVR